MNYVVLGNFKKKKERRKERESFCVVISDQKFWLKIYTVDIDIYEEECKEKKDLLRARRKL